MIAVAGFGLFSLVGGLIGYFKAQSKASLIAGGISGLVLIMCAYGISRGNRAALFVSLLTALLLGGRFFGTWLQKRRLMPDLLMVLFSLVILILVGRKLL